MKILSFIQIAFLITSCLTIVSCSKDDETQTRGTFSHGVFITNEGPFQTGTGTLTFYDSDSNKLKQDVFAKINGRPLGNIVQSMAIYNNKGYIVVNNAGRVEVVDIMTLKSLAVISDLTYPRYFLGIDNTKAYISEWSGKVAVVDLSTNTVSKTISTGAGPEAMVKSGNYVYVANSGGFGSDSTVSVIDISTDKVVKSILCGDVPSGMVVDANNNLWVLCKGKGYSGWPASGDTPGRILRINQATLSVDYTFYFTSSGDHPEKLVTNKEKTMCYFLFDNCIYRIDVTAGILKPEKFIAKAFYSLGLDIQSGLLYASDPVDYQQDGWVFRYNTLNGKKVDSLKAGIIPGNFAFVE